MFSLCIYNLCGVWVEIARYNDVNEAYYAYDSTCNLALELGTDCAVINNMTGEVVVNLEDFDDDDGGETFMDLLTRSIV